MPIVNMEGLYWNSKNIITPRFMYGEDKWPRLVKAANGHYGTVNCETYSEGDEMVMLGAKGFPRVVARDYKYKPECAELPLTVALDAMKTTGSSYSIPLMLTSRGNQLCTVQILPLRRSSYVYKTAQDLLEPFPRFVKVNRSFSIHPRQPMVKKGAILELLQTDLRMEAEGNGPSKFLICACEERRIPLKMDTWGDFTVDDDACHYTLQEVVERFPLPQRIHFSVMPAGLKTNDIVLYDEVTYDVLISIPLAAIVDESLTAQTDFDIIYFPVSSESDFLDCTSSRDSDAYQAVIKKCRKNFGMGHFKDVNVVCKEVSMLEIQFHPYGKAYDKLPKCPPSVFPRKTGRKPPKSPPKNTGYRTPPALPTGDSGDSGYISPSQRRRGNADSDMFERPISCYDEAGNWTHGHDDDSTTALNLEPPPVLPPKPNQNKIQSMSVKPKAATMLNRNPSHLYRSPPLVSIIDRPEPKSNKGARNKEPKYLRVTFKVAKKIGDVFKKTPSESDDTGSHVLNNLCGPSEQEEKRDSPGSGSDSDIDKYDYPEDIETWLGVGPGCQDYVNQPPSIGAVPQEVVKKIFNDKKRSESMRTKKQDKALKPKKNNLELAKASTMNNEYVSKSEAGVSDIYSRPKYMTDYSVEEVANLVREAGQLRIASVLEEHMVDGDFFKSLRAEQFTCAPFNASPFEIEALKRIQKGKVPKKRKYFAEYSFAEVANHVREAGQVRIASILEKNMVDGDFFMSLQTEELRCAPFNASPYEIKALKRIQMGKVPKKTEG